MARSFTVSPSIPQLASSLKVPHATEVPCRHKPRALVKVCPESGRSISDGITDTQARYPSRVLNLTTRIHFDHQHVNLVSLKYLQS